MSDFWSTALGYVDEPPPAGYLSWEAFLRANDIATPRPGSIGAIVDPNNTGPRILFMQVPEQKVVKNRVHLDIAVNDREHAAECRVELVATRVDGPCGDSLGNFIVLCDSEGNQFAVVTG